jgi:hypothetical protein
MSDTTDTTDTTDTAGVYGTLTNYRTGEAIRPATVDELAASLAAGPTGAFEAEVDGETVVCFVG